MRKKSLRTLAPALWLLTVHHCAFQLGNCPHGDREAQVSKKGIKLRDVHIWWNPTRKGLRPVHVCKFLGRDEPKRDDYHCNHGACWYYWPENATIADLFRVYIMLSGEGVEHKAIYHEFWKIAEFRDMMINGDEYRRVLKLISPSKRKS